MQFLGKLHVGIVNYNLYIALIFHDEDVLEIEKELQDFKHVKCNYEDNTFLILIIDYHNFYYTNINS